MLAHLKIVKSENVPKIEKKKIHLMISARNFYRYQGKLQEKSTQAAIYEGVIVHNCVVVFFRN